VALLADVATAKANAAEEPTGSLSAQVAGFERATTLAALERNGQHIINPAKDLREATCIRSASDWA